MSAVLHLQETFDPLELYDQEIGSEFKVVSPFQQRLEREQAEARRGRTTVENWRAISSTRERLPKIEPNAERFATARRHERRAYIIHTALTSVVFMLLLSAAGFALAVLLRMV
jgi:hypothetical protein